MAVIPAACDDCPIHEYNVADSCRFCLGKACLQACRFGAISRGDSKMKIDPLKCKSCGMCAKACPFGAIGSKTFSVEVIKAILAGKRVVAMCDPVLN